MQISVTLEDMKKGIINSLTSDPVALAAQRAGLRLPIVGLTRMSYLDEQGDRVTVPLPAQVTSFIKKLAYGDRFEALVTGPKDHPRSFTFVI